MSQDEARQIRKVFHQACNGNFKPHRAGTMLRELGKRLPYREFLRVWDGDQGYLINFENERVWAGYRPDGGAIGEETRKQIGRRVRWLIASRRAES